MARRPLTAQRVLDEYGVHWDEVVPGDGSSIMISLGVKMPASPDQVFSSARNDLWALVEDMEYARLHEIVIELGERLKEIAERVKTTNHENKKAGLRLDVADALVGFDVDRVLNVTCALYDLPKEAFDVRVFFRAIGKDTFSHTINLVANTEIVKAFKSKHIESLLKGT